MHDLKQRARELRKNATPQEQKLWYQFLRRHPVKFRRQQQIDCYIADFYCPFARLIIELDGGGHYQPEGREYDRWRDAYIQAQGINILRFSNSQVDEEFEAVCETINRNLPPQSASPTAPPQGGSSERLD